MKRLLTAVIIVLSATQASANPLGGLLRTFKQIAGGAKKVVPGPTKPAGASVPVGASDAASLKAALDRAVAPKTTAAASLASARPIVERLLTTMGCATSASALHSLNRDRLTPATYGFSDNDNRTAMGYGIGMTHDRRTCMQVARVTELQQRTLNSLSFRTYYVSASSGEARNVTSSLRLMDGTWLIDEIGYFQK